MRFVTILVSFLFLILLSTSAMSQDYAIESFDYAVGSTLDSLLGGAENGFSGPWYFNLDGGTNGLGAVSDSGLDYEGTEYEIPNSGNHAQVNNPGSWAAARWIRPLASHWNDEAGKIYWLSFLFEAKGIPSANTYYLIKFFNTDTSEVLAMGKAGGGTTYTCGSGWPGTDQKDHRSDVVCEGGTMWFVIKMVMSGNEGDERTYMWLNPDPTAEPDTMDADVTMNASVDDGFDRIVLECGGDDVMETHWDEIRLGTSYEAVAVTALPRINQNIPEKFVLSQNYPNPFNPITRINFSILNKGHVNLSVYNVAGQKVAELVNDVLNIGNHEAQFSAVNLPSGIYFYRLNTKNGMITKKMTLLK